ncbi:MAG: hypothetical protein A3A80_02210 [Candidatus Terrybacteria bacterium RIFCSPLOWO2_01_FULL_44_24]|uniref:Uncharacterized protein n=1 Tax=Candidatus Terrybacteria bacterium RIFCSPHIGHO2_01_FULL_43_35 TaxID=1802361 RepID=A0A1G2PE93_9BACT|nr:MAG: hypothetical protein A2828_02000 [Candidatus Terrybacteria bacterium RIFCSPHIGHO2_01_FULL_43_35]OHA50893.1 MAG: hypothetical protein A3A80_02210 [Candidatus Terrybacteria bacterium RIFCSPLOWO2_01_FULL_44_24]
MTIGAFFIFILFSAILSLAAIIIALHFWRYGVQGDKSKLLSMILMLSCIVFFGTALVIFITVPWNLLEQIVGGI